MVSIVSLLYQPLPLDLMDFYSGCYCEQKLLLIAVRFTCGLCPQLCSLPSKDLGREIFLSLFFIFPVFMYLGKTCLKGFSVDSSDFYLCHFLAYFLPHITFLWKSWVALQVNANISFIYQIILVFLRFFTLLLYSFQNGISRLLCFTGSSLQVLVCFRDWVDPVFTFPTTAWRVFFRERH